MPCGDKWKNKLMRRIPVGIGAWYGGYWRGLMVPPAGQHLTYRPGCPSISIPGVHYNYTAMQMGRFQPQTITGVIPLRGIGGQVTGYRTIVRDHQRPWWCDYYPSYDRMTHGPAALRVGGRASGTRDYGYYWGFQRHHNLWPPRHRVGPYPVSQRPYYVGYPITAYIEPFAGCPTRQAPYLIPDPYHHQPQLMGAGIGGARMRRGGLTPPKAGTFASYFTR